MKMLIRVWCCVCMVVLTLTSGLTNHVAADHATPIAGTVARGVSSAVNGYGFPIPNPLAANASDRTGDQLRESCTACPILTYGGYTYWAYDHFDNRVAVAIVAYDAAGNIAGQWYGTGDRYIQTITVDEVNQTVNFLGQYFSSLSRVFISIPWSTLHLGDPVPPPPTTYDVCPLFDTTRQFKAGSTVPVRFQLCDGSWVNLSSPGVVVSATGFYQVSGGAVGAPQDAGNANVDGNFRFDESLGGYIFNLSTKDVPSGTYALTFTVDGIEDETYVIYIELR